MTKIYIGCSGFHYKEWKDVFYPEKLPQNKWFEFYTSQFNTLELNSTFYRFPTMKSLHKWFDTSPEHFMFSAKVPKVVTHFKKFNDCHGYMQDFYGLCEEGLKEKMGCVLFQLHPQIQYSPETLEKIIQIIDGRFRNVLECRHASWWDENVFKN
jgi:uncharacterized protein YecE (DUF72 family)